jgi:hypothetical protein
MIDIFMYRIKLQITLYIILRNLYAMRCDALMNLCVPFFLYPIKPLVLLDYSIRASVPSISPMLYSWIG